MISRTDDCASVEGWVVDRWMPFWCILHPSPTVTASAAFPTTSLYVGDLHESV